MNILRSTTLAFILTLSSLVFSFSGYTQTISGNLSSLNNQMIRLIGFNGFSTYFISSGAIDSAGNFKLNYSRNDYGVGYLISADEKPLYVILCGEDIEIRGEALGYTETIQILKGEENQLFEQYAIDHPKREQALSAWVYLEKLYSGDSFFAEHNQAYRSIISEKLRIKDEDDAFLKKLPMDSYVSWFLPIRKLISAVSIIAQYRTEEIPSTIDAFRKIDYCDSRLYKSGLFRDAIESHFWLLENSGSSVDSVFIEMEISMDAMIENLAKDEKKLNEVTNYLFDLLERHSLFKASEYLALKVLNQTSCTIDSDLAKQLETYRTMKIGNIAPDIFFEGDNHSPDYRVEDFLQKLSDLESDYTLVVFGASWCPKCTEELPEIAKHYSTWKGQGVEVVFVSLDEDRASYLEFVKDFPFLSTCDYKKWESTVVKDYYVFATPTMYLLDSDRKIILRPNSVIQMDAWVNWYLVQGNINR